MLTVRRPQPPLGWRWGNGSADLHLLRSQEPGKTGWREGEERGFQGRPAQTVTKNHQRPRRGLEAEVAAKGHQIGTKTTREEGRASWLLAPHGGGRMQQVRGEDSGRPSSVQACRRSPACLSDTGRTLLGGQHRGGWPGSRPLRSREPGPGRCLLHDRLSRSSGWGAADE